MKRKINKYLSLVFIILFLLCPRAVAQESAGSGNRSNIPEAPSQYLTNPVTYPIKFFADTLSRADGDRCPMYPNCSAYSLQAFQRHGFLKGWVMTSDRLMRCGRDEHKHAKDIWINGDRYVYDPLSNNDFWW